MKTAELSDTAMDAKGSDGASALEDYATRVLCEDMRSACLQRLQSLASSSDMFTEKDLERYSAGALSDSSLHMAGKRTYAEKTQALQENLTTFIPQTIARVQNAERSFYAQLAQARAKGLINDQTAKIWNSRLKSKGMPWWKKEEFLRTTFPRLLANWEHLHEDIEKLKTLSAKKKEYGAIPEVQRAVRGKGLSKYKDWRNAVDEAFGAIGSFEKGDASQSLFHQAKAKLTQAANDGVLSKHKIGLWLDRIFKSKASPKEISLFINGNGSTSLPNLIKGWAEMRTQFDQIERMRQSKGTPRGFHFVSTGEFLKWHYGKRLAYVKEARNRFVNVSQENPLLLGIRRELDSKDWDSAQHLIAQAESTDLSAGDRKKLDSMRWYLKEHQAKDGGGKGTDQALTPEQAEKKLDAIIAKLPSSLQPLYIRSIQSGKFDCLAALMYNRVWCREKGNVLDNRKEAKLRETAAKDTAKLLQEGHGKRFENNDVRSHHEPAVRSYANTGVNAPQVLHVNMSGAGSLVSRIEEEDNEQFRYWTTLIPEGVDYGTHSYIVKNMHHEIKKCIRARNA